MYTHTLFLTVHPNGIVEGFYAFGDHPRDLPREHGMHVGQWHEVIDILNPAPEARIVVRRACERCGGAKHSDRSCDCFDNGCS